MLANWLYNLCRSGKQMRVDIRSDAGTFAGMFAPDPWDVLMPSALSSTDFETLRRRLTGFNEVSRIYTLASLGVDAGPALETELTARVRRMMNVYLVQGPGLGELMFAASGRKGMMEEKVLVTLISSPNR